MPWLETEGHNRRLFEALNRLAQEKGALVRLAGAINADERAKRSNLARKGNGHKGGDDLIAPSTLTRWQQEGLARVMAAQPHKKRLVFEFLERSGDFRTALYNPAPGLPEGLADYIAEHHGALSELRFDRLSNLDGTYRLYRRSWTTPERRDRVLVSRLVIQTLNGLTRFGEEQDYLDDARYGMHVQENDTGFVFNSGMNLFLLGFGKDGPRVKYFVIHEWHPPVDSRTPVFELKGILIGVTGKGPHPAFPFVAYRASEPTFATEILPHTAVDPKIAAWIGCGGDGAE